MGWREQWSEFCVAGSRQGKFLGRARSWIRSGFILSLTQLQFPHYGGSYKVFGACDCILTTCWRLFYYDSRYTPWHVGLPLGLLPLRILQTHSKNDLYTIIDGSCKVKAETLSYYAAHLEATRGQSQPDN